MAWIAAAYSRVELELEKGIGPALAAEVERWLSGQGLALQVERLSTACLAEGFKAGRPEQGARSEFT